MIWGAVGCGAVTAGVWWAFAVAWGAARRRQDTTWGVEVERGWPANRPGRHGEPRSRLPDGIQRIKINLSVQGI